MTGRESLQNAEWLLGFDFDGTLADPSNNHSVSQRFFQVLTELKKECSIAWGICTGRSLEFLIEGMEKAGFPYWPNYVVTQERDIFYLDASGSHYVADVQRNQAAEKALKTLFINNAATIAKVKSYVNDRTNGQWVSEPNDPAGIIAEVDSEIAEAVKIYNECPQRCSDLHYQRNTIYLRFSHRNYCKGTAIKYLQRTYSIDHSKTLVMGDNYNDITMLNSDVAKYYGGPANSIKMLKNALLDNQGFITKASYADGVVEAIQRLVLL